MGAYAAMFGGETATASNDENLIAPKKSTMYGLSQQFQPNTEEDSLDALMRGSVERNKLKSKQANQPVVKEQMQQQLQQAQQQPQQQPNFLQRLGQGTAALGDVTVGGILPMAGYVAQGAVRPFTTPQKAEEFGSQISSALDKPFGKAFGVTETPGYKSELTSNVMNFIAENAHKGDKWIANFLHLPIEDVKHMIDTVQLGVGAKASPYIAKPLETAGKKVFSLEEQFAKKVPKVSVENVRVEPTFVPEQGQQLQPNPVKRIDQLIAEGKTPEAAQAQVAGEAANVQNSKQPLGQAQTVAPVERTITVPEEVPPMPEKPLAADELANREDILRKVGIENIRKSALENNPKEASSQFITSQASQEAYGHGMTEQINHEKSALENHFSGIEKEAGGHTVRHGTQFQEGDKIAVGKTVKSALEEGHKKYVQAGHDLYNEAKTNHGDKPVSIGSFQEFLNDKSNFAYAEEQNLQKGIVNYMEQKGLIKDGVIQDMTVADAEGVRKYINSKYKYDTSALGGQLKGLIDKDVFQQVGGPTYEKARKHWGTGKDIYENPKATGDLLSDQGVNQKISDEKVMTKILTADNSQFSHLFDTLKKDNQTKAVNQIKTSLVEQIRQAGQSAVNQPWNSVAAAKEAARLSEKLKIAFSDSPEQLQKVYDGIDAGNIVHIPAKYPGAAVQSHLLNNKFSELAVQRGATALGTSAGAYIGGPVGAVVGGALGEKGGAAITGKSRTKRQTQQLEKEIKYGEGRNTLFDIKNPKK